MAQVVGPAIAVLVGWLIAQVSGGVQKRREERVLWLLDVSRQLADTPLGPKSRALAEREVSTFLATRGTRGRLSAWVLLMIACAAVSVTFLVGSVIPGVAPGMRLQLAATGVAYAGMVAWAARRVRDVYRQRMKQRPAPSIEIAR